MFARINMSKQKRSLLLGLGFLVLITGCGSSQAAPTCDEFAEMSDDTGLFSSFTEEQTTALNDALLDRGFDDGVYNQTLGRTNIMAFCNIFDGIASQNHERPITEAFD